MYTITNIFLDIYALLHILVIIYITEKICISVLPNLHTNYSYLRVLLKYRILGPHLEILIFVCVGPRICVSKILGDADGCCRSKINTSNGTTKYYVLALIFNIPGQTREMGRLKNMGKASIFRKDHGNYIEMGVM